MYYLGRGSGSLRPVTYGDFAMLSSRTDEKGSYLIEVAVVTMGLVFFIVGAFDVARIFQARGAVRAGVREGLRCLYPTDHGCSGVVSPGPSPPSTLFDAWVWKHGVLYAVPHQPWTAAASWIAEPGLETPQVERSIQSIDIEQKKYRFEQQEVLYPVQAHSPYILQVRSLPRVGGTNPLNPKFFIPATTEEMSSNETKDLTSVGTSSSNKLKGIETGFEDRFNIGSFTFNASKAWASSAGDMKLISEIEASKGVEVPCYSDSRVQDGNDPTLQWAQSPRACQYRDSNKPLWSSGKLSVPLMFQISGTASVITGANKGSGGKILISMSWNDGTRANTKRLGGRAFSGDAGGNFIVRGAALSDVKEESRKYYENYTDEITDYGTLPLVPFDTQVTINFYLVSTDGKSVGWRGDKIKLFYPSFAFAHEIFDCRYSADPSKCAQQPANVVTLYNTVDLSQQLTLNTPPAAVCQRTEKEGYEPDPSRRLQEISSCISTTGSCSSRCIDLGGCNPAPHRFWTGDLQPSGVCEVGTKNYLCDELKKRYLMGCVPSDDDLSKIPPECTVSDFNPVLDKLQKINYSPQVMVEPDKRLACSGEPLPECAKPHRSVTKEEEVWPVTPERAQQCSDARFRTPGSFTTEPLPVNYCIDRGAELEKKYREKNKVPISVPIDVKPGEKQDQYQPAPPTDICIPSTPVDGELEKSLCGERLSRSAAYQCCKDNGERCKLKPIVDLKPGDPVNNDDKLFLSAAAKRVVDTVQVGYPPAQRLNTCDGKAKNCLMVSTKLIDDRKRAQVSAEVTVPLQLSALFGSNGVTVRHDETRLMEHTFLAE